MSGSVVVSGAFTTTASVQLEAAPLTMCAPTFAPTQQFNATAQVYVVTVRLVQGDTCAGGEPAPAGVAVAMTVTQPSASPTTTALSTTAGAVSLSIPVPWGASVLVLASGAGATVSSSVLGPAHPAVVSCLRWKRDGKVYSVEAVVKNGAAAFPLAAVDFTIAPATLGAVSPSKTSTGSDGVASTVVTVNDLANLPVVEAVSGNSSLTTALTADNEVVCP